MLNCSICGNGFDLSPDSLVLCRHKEGGVHMGCCVDRCSLHGAPCDNSIDVFHKKVKLD
ncbi:MAG: hypothetical protein KKD39_02060 [Candidatus Altiarchaeota archaeon]|nr:hypothetical protein [Candidatus Altiarchaeota archaeon]